MWEVVAITAMAHYQAEMMKLWEQKYSNASPEEKQRMLFEKNEQAKRDQLERHHKEIVQAIRDSKPSPQSSSSGSGNGFMMGFILGELLH